MSITSAFVLPEDVLVFPVSELAPALRSRIPGGPDDFAITRPYARHPSKLVDPDAAALIESFRAPKTIVEAVIAFSAARGIDPRSTLDAAFPLVQQLVAAGLLLPASSEQANRIGASLDPGAVFVGWTVHRTVHVVEDTEVHYVLDSSGRGAALKLARPGHAGSMRQAMRHEVAILRHIEGLAAPRLLGAGEEAGRPYLLMEWCEGVPAPVLAARLRGDSDAEASRRLLMLALSVLRAYADLHARGVIHGDVHPNNVLATEDGPIRVLDFGLARVISSASSAGAPPRGGIPFYLDPLWAEAARAGRPPPPADEASEQYALAALVRELLAGRPYLDFSIDRDRMLQQIVEDRPEPFIRHGVRPWLEAERVLGRALAKDPAARFASVADFADTLARADRSPPPAAPDGAPAALLRSVLARVAPGGAAYAALDEPSPLCSVNTGAAGIAYMLYRVASAREDPALLSLAELWCARAERHADDEASFYSADLDLTPQTIGRVSLFHTAAGVACVQTLVAVALGNETLATDAAARFVARSRGPCDSLDLTLGRSSTLLGCAALLAAVPAQAAGPRATIVALGDEIADEINCRIAELPPVGERQALNLGIAHGWGGVLFSLLRWRETCARHEDVRDDTATAIESRLRQLAKMAVPVSHGLQWAWLTDQPETDSVMPGWCNGSAGLVHLWTLAHRAFGREEYATLARGAAANTWHAVRDIGDLCCGAAGRAYAMLTMYRNVGDAEWLARARALAEHAAASIGGWSLRRDSLYKGEAGVALLVADLEQPELSAMPLFNGEA